MELKPLFKDIADAIREKGGTAGAITASAFPERIRAIPTGTVKPALKLYVAVETSESDGYNVEVTCPTGPILKYKGIVDQTFVFDLDRHGTYEVSAYTESGISDFDRVTFLEGEKDIIRVSLYLYGE